MKQTLDKIGRVLEYGHCFQVLDIPVLNEKTLRSLHNHTIIVRSCSSSLSGFELIVYKEKKYNYVLIYIIMIAVFAITCSILWLW